MVCVFRTEFLFPSLVVPWRTCLPQVRIEGMMQATGGMRGRNGAGDYGSTLTENGIEKGLL